MPRAFKVFSLILVITMSLTVMVGAQSQLIGDLNSDYTVNIRDLQTFAWDWLSLGCLVFDCTANLDGVDGVNMADFAILANNWQVVEPRIIISEFMASNASDVPLEDGELLDGEGESSDWIEIYNPTDTTISLDGWYLTNDDANLTMWQFPDGLEVKPGEFLIVFASDRTFELYPYNYPYLDAGDYYHTNFNLDKDPGEYLALVAADGSTIVHEYAKEYPPQLTNISYGLAQYAAKLVPTGATATYHIPTSSDESLGSDWTTSGFDDSGWDSGPTGIGFGVSGITYENLEAYYEFEGNASDSSGNGNDGTLIGDVTFEIDPERGEVLSLPGGSNQYVQIGSVGISGNMPRTIACWAKADHTSIPDWTLIIGFTTLVGGCGSHFNIGSLGGPGGVGAHAWCWEETIFSDTEALDWHHYAMSYDGTAITYYGDGILMDTDPGNSNVIDLSIQADNFHVGSRITQDSSFPGKVDDACIYSRVLSDDEISMVVDGSTIETDVQTQMQNVNASLWTRIEFDIEEGEESLFNTLTLRMKYEDGFVAYLNGQKVAWGNAPDIVMWDSTALLDRPVEDSLVFEEFNITAFLHVLEPGKNVLAIHGLNENENDDEFLILPELVAARNRVVPEYFTTPTPGTFNISGAVGRVSDIWVSTKGTFYTGPPDWHIPLTLSTATDGAEIRYTLDGSRPTITHGLTFDTLTDPPLEIDRTTILRAVGVKPGWLDSKVETHTYLFPDDVIKQSPTGLPPGPNWPGYSVNGQVINYGMDPCIVYDPVYGGQLKGTLKAISTISLVTDLANLFDPLIGIYVNARQDGYEWERPVSVELLNPDGSEGFHINAGLRIRGAFSRSGDNPKHSLRLFFRNEYGAGKLQYPLFGSEGVDEFDKIDLRTSQNNSWAFQGSTQNTLIRDVFSRDVQRDMGQPYSRSRYYHLYINGHYWGLYQTEERADADFAESYLGGDKEEYDVVKNDSSSTRVLHATDGTMEAYRRLYDAAVAGFSSDSAYLAVQGLRPDGTPDPSGERLLDPENLMDYMICTYYTGDPDAPVSCWAHFSNNVFAIYNRVRPKGFTWYRHDAEHSLGANGGVYEGRLLTDPTDRSVGQYWEDFNPAWLHLRMTTSPEYLLQFADRVHKYFYNGGLLSAAPNVQRWMTRADQIDMAIIAESARWGDSKREPPLTKVHWEGQNNYMVNTFFPGRTQIVINQMRSVDMFPDLDAPVFNINDSYQHGGHVSVGDELSMDNPNSSGNIYYTLDGTDPRQAFSGNPIGTNYTGPINLTKSTHVKARVLDGGTWSALNEVIFAIGPVKEYLRITEIMYRPRNTGNINDPNEEFIELTNIGQDTLNINLARFSEGIDFTFPDIDLDPGECVVVVKNQAAFQAQYGTSVNIAGQYTGSLANDGEGIKLVDAIGRTILDFEYKDGWRPITDGDGFSLTMIEPGDAAIYGSEEGLTAHWKLDDGTGGTAIDSVGTNHGTLNGDATWATGRFDGALSLDGDGDYVSLASINELTGDTLTIQTWVRLSELAGASNPILTQHVLSMTNDGYYFYVANEKPIFYLIDGFSSAQTISSETISRDQWVHIAGTNDGSNLKLYVNGKLKASASSTGLTGTSNNAYIGHDTISSYYYNGLIDDVRIYDRAVSESEFEVIGDPLTRWSQKDSWRASVYRNGTPGWDDRDILPNPGAVVINEVMSHSNNGPDWIELHNTTDEPINIGGWFLSDNNNDEPNLMKYRIANGTMINDNSYLVFYQDSDFNNPGDPGCLVPFGLSENGEKVCLSSHLDLSVMLTGYREVEDFGASATNVSFGRYFKSSTDNFNFVAMDYNTPDTNNVYPRVGPVVINEIMYNPPTGNQKEEYIELHNITGAPYTLYRLDKFSSWKFTDGIDLTFSSSPPVTIPANGYLLVVKDLTSFTARYGSIPGVQIVEDYDGWLSNSGERLQIGMPGDVDEIGTRQYIRIDRVTYSDGSHPEDVPGGVDYWPFMADGFGFSLSRRVPSAYGNDVSNWQGALPTPGAANP